MQIPIISGLISLGQTWLVGKNKKTAAKAEAEAQVMITASQSTADWEKIMAKATESSWKDEFLIVVLFSPAIACFFPGGPDAVKAGFDALATMPEYYQHFLYIGVLASFGIKGVKGIKNLKN